jgi:hypothetical protein
MTQDDEDREYRRLSRQVFWAYGVALALLILGNAMEAVNHDPEDWRPILPLGLSIALMFYALPKLSELRSLAYPRRHREVNQKYYRILLLMLAAQTCIGAETLSQISLPLTAHSMLMLILPLLGYILTPAMFLFGPGRERDGEMAGDDELAQALRSRAFRFGYAATLIVMAGLVVAALLQPAALLPVLAWGLALAEVLPIAIYVVLDWRSDAADKE